MSIHRSTRCFFPEQTIATPNGMIPLKNIKAGDQVFDFSGKLTYVSKIIVNPQGISSLWFNNSIIPTIKL